MVEYLLLWSIIQHPRGAKKKPKKEEERSANTDHVVLYGAMKHGQRLLNNLIKEYDEKDKPLH